MTAPAGKTPWLLTKAGVFVGLTLVGPLALILLWKSPDFTRRGKIVLTAISLALTVVFMAVTPMLVKTLESQLAAIQSL